MTVKMGFISDATPGPAAVAVARCAIGGASWVAPVTAGRVFALKLESEANAPLLLRMGGTRDFALAAGVLGGTREARVRALRIGQACDVGDIAATLIAVRRGRMSPLAAALFVGASAACLVLGAKAASQV
jgi:hypothetical protein